jgi:diadenosine tetraphosphate (Ap4A) HIT family hydrolase
MTTATRASVHACLVCAELAGEVSLPGGFLIDSEQVAVFHLPPVSGPVYLGHLLVVSRRHCPDFAGLQPKKPEPSARR